MRIFFATDIHGSDTCWWKFLNSGKHYDADAIVLGGDMTGKAVILMVDAGDGRWYATLLENRHDLNNEDEAREFEEAVRRRGYYLFRTTPEELREFQADDERTTEFFHDLMLGRVQSWLDLADERLADADLRCFVCPGNDDQFEVDEVIASAQRVEACEAAWSRSTGSRLASTGWSTGRRGYYREEDEPDLEKRIETRFRGDGATRAHNLRFPPPAARVRLTRLRTHRGHEAKDAGRARSRRARQPCGGIEWHQPLSLHGHIHESRGHPG